MNRHISRAIAIARLGFCAFAIATLTSRTTFTFASNPNTNLVSEFTASGPFRATVPLPLTQRDQHIMWAGSVVTQGDAVQGGPSARSTFGVSGSGIKVGIISDSFNYFAGQTDGILSGNLPGPGNPNGYNLPVTILNDEMFPGNIDEGRAIAELVHDIAPGAEIMFHSAFNNAQSSPGGTIATAIDNLVAAGANIIIDDVFTLGTPVYQDGVAAQAVNNAYANGVAYFSSAGNNSNNAYEAVYTPLDGSHDFDANLNEGGDNLLNIGLIPNGGSVMASLWWDDPYTSLGGTPTSDFQLGLYNMTDNLVEGGSLQDQMAGADPFEAFAFTNTSGVAKNYGLFVEHAAGDPNKLFKIQVFNGQIQDDDDTDSPTIGGHNSAAGALAVGAAPFFNPDNPELFTSHGPTTILYDPEGNALATPELRNTPSLIGIDGGNTSFFLADSGIDDDVFPNFFGTSASAPHVAAIAALVLERATQLGKTLSPAELYNILINSTIDMGTPGYDSITGYGRLDAYRAVASVPEPSALVLFTIAGVCLLNCGKRSRCRFQNT